MSSQLNRWGFKSVDSNTFWTGKWNKNEEERTFALTPYQGKKLDNTFSDLLKELKNESNPEEVVGLLFRHGLMSYKIAMILSVL